MSLLSESARILGFVDSGGTAPASPDLVRWCMLGATATRNLHHEMSGEAQFFIEFADLGS